MMIETLHPRLCGSVRQLVLVGYPSWSSKLFTLGFWTASYISLLSCCDFSTRAGIADDVDYVLSPKFIVAFYMLSVVTLCTFREPPTIWSTKYR